MKQFQTDSELEDQLIAQASGNTPVFSEALHERIMARITSRSPSARDRRIRQGSDRSFRWMLTWIPAGLAAAMLIVLAIVLYPRHTRVVAGAVPSIPRIESPVRVLDRPEVATAGYVQLDRDGARLLDYMARQIDVVPTKQ
jgi:hypothetical protein